MKKLLIIILLLSVHISTNAETWRICAFNTSCRIVFEFNVPDSNAKTITGTRIFSNGRKDKLEAYLLRSGNKFHMQVKWLIVAPNHYLYQIWGYREDNKLITKQTSIHSNNRRDNIYWIEPGNITVNK